MLMRQFLFLALLCLPVLSLLAQDAERTSKNDPRLKRWLEAQPASDKNKDGILTMEEARAWQQARRAERNQKARADRPKPTRPISPTAITSDTYSISIRQKATNQRPWSSTSMAAGSSPEPRTT